MNYTKTAKNVDLHRFMGKWYVLAGRFTFLEAGVHNGVETYTWNSKHERVDISFTFNKNSLTGPLKSIPQKGWIKNKTTNAHWLVSPFWPIKLDYLIIDLADDYSWTAIGVPNGKYLWIMARKQNISEVNIEQILEQLKQKGYPVDNVIFVPHGK